MQPFLDIPPTLPKVTEQLVRLSDPEPSQDAAAVEYLGAAAERVLRTLVEIERTCRHRVGGTANEIRDRMAYDAIGAPDRGSIARRLTSLERHGYVADTDERRDGGRGVNVTVYQATPEGRAWLTTEGT